METLLVILAWWLIPAIVGYIIVVLETRSFTPDRRAWILLVPILNIVVVGLCLANIIGRIGDYLR